jgi:hypothetical protein
MTPTKGRVAPRLSRSLRSNVAQFLLMRGRASRRKDEKTKKFGAVVIMQKVEKRTDSF